MRPATGPAVVECVLDEGPAVVECVWLQDQLLLSASGYRTSCLHHCQEGDFSVRPNRDWLRGDIL